jgi:hypothetical protein
MAQKLRFAQNDTLGEFSRILLENGDFVFRPNRARG